MLIIRNSELINFLIEKKNTTLSSFLKKFKTNISTLQNLHFTDYKYNILQISVYFLNFDLIQSIFEEKEFFNFLNYECFYSNDSLWDICICKHNIKMFEFLFDKVFIPLKDKKTNLKNGKEDKYNDNPLFYIHKENFIEEIYFWVNEWKENNSFNSISTENLNVLEKFFSIVKNDVDKKKLNLINNPLYLKKVLENKNNNFEKKEKKKKYFEEKIEIKKNKTDLDFNILKEKIEIENNSFNLSKSNNSSNYDYTSNNEKIEFIEKNIDPNSKSNSSFLEENIYFIQNPVGKIKNNKKKQVKKINYKNFFKDISRNKCKTISTKRNSLNTNNKIFSFKNMKKLNCNQEFFNKDISCKFMKKNTHELSSFKERNKNQNSNQFFYSNGSSYKNKSTSKFFKEKTKKDLSKLKKEKKNNNENNHSYKFFKTDENLSSNKPINKLKINFFQSIFQSKNNLIDEEI